MARKKCTVCGALYPGRFPNCPQCEFFRNREHARLESCTGVRYPCSHHCRTCFFDEVYRKHEQGEIKDRQPALLSG